MMANLRVRRRIKRNSPYSRRRTARGDESINGVSRTDSFQVIDNRLSLRKCANRHAQVLCNVRRLVYLACADALAMPRGLTSTGPAQVRCTLRMFSYDAAQVGYTLRRLVEQPRKWPAGDFSRLHGAQADCKWIWSVSPPLVANCPMRAPIENAIKAVFPRWSRSKPVNGRSADSIEPEIEIRITLARCCPRTQSMLGESALR